MGESASKPAGVSPAVLVLSLLLAVATTTAVLFAVRPVAPAAGTAGGGTMPAAQAEPPPAEPSTQKDTVTPRDHPTGQVFYPLPFSTRPNLKLTAPTRVYEVVKEDELGFAWAVRPKADDFRAEFLQQKGVLLEGGVWVKEGAGVEGFGIAAVASALR